MASSWRNLKAALDSAGVRPSKRLGQNFLLDKNLMRIVVDEAELGEDDVVLEVGCATGELTALLSEKAGKVVAVEIDARLAGIAQGNLAERTNVVFMTCDILENKRELNLKVVAMLHELLREEAGRRLKCVSNPPYSISSPLICALFLSDLALTLMVLTLQEEVARRISAEPGTKDYGTISILAQLFSEVKPVRAIPPQAFWPRPEVGSTIVKFTVKPAPGWQVGSKEGFLLVLRAAFGYRRKKLGNALAKVMEREAAEEILKRSGLDPQRRGETLTPEEALRLANMLAQRGSLGARRRRL